MDQLHIDFETRSELDLTERGLDNYARHPSTESILLAWAINEGRVNLWQPHRDGPQLPAECREALRDPFVIKYAWNASFERTILHRRHGIWVPYDEWVDPMVNARHLSMPGSLEDAGEVLGLKNDEAKISEGKRLIKLFCEPAVPAVTGGLFGDVPASFNDHRTHPQDWELFCDYCCHDVVAERAIKKKFKATPLPAGEARLWYLDQRINDAGIPVDMALVGGARMVTERELTKLRAELREITHLENPNSTDQMLAWVREQGYPFGALGKAFVARAFAGEGNLTPLGRRALELRALTSKSSIHKFTAIADNVTSDGRLRNQFVFSGAARTARWSGRDVQLQNLPRPTKEVEKKMDRAVELLRAADYDAIRAEFSSPLDVVTSCTRAAFKTPPGKRFVVCDLSAIENRVLGWVSGCDAILRVFREGLDPYKDFGADLYGKPYDEITKEERQNSKPAVLGCGYQLSGGEEEVNDDGDIEKTGLWGYAAAMGVDITRDEAHRAVEVFRTKFAEVTAFWGKIEEAAIRCVRSREDQTIGPLRFHCIGTKMLQLILPSGRPLNYIRPRVDVSEEISKRTGNPYKKTTLSYEGVNQTTRQWSRIATYGGKWTENAVQAIARDILAECLTQADARGFAIVGHVHDEIITEVPYTSELGLKDLEHIMSTAPPWAAGMMLAAEGYENEYYKK